MPRERFEIKKGLELAEERKSKETLIEEKIKKAKERKEPQEIVTEFEHGKIKEIICPENLAPGFYPIVTKELLFETKDGKSISFYKEVPRKVYLLRGLYNIGKLERQESWDKIESTFEYNPYYDRRQKRWEAIIEYGDLTKPGNTLSFLHEIGHSKSIYLKERKKIELAILDIENKFLNYNEKVKKSGRLNPGQTEIETKIWDDEKKDYDSVIVPKKDYIKYLKLKANDERYAWAVALKILRKYRKEGIDLAPGLSEKEIEKIVHGLDNLGGYERDYIESIKDEKLKEKLKGTFSLKYYNLKPL